MPAVPAIFASYRVRCRSTSTQYRVRDPGPECPSHLPSISPTGTSSSSRSRSLGRQRFVLHWNDNTASKPRPHGVAAHGFLESAQRTTPICHTPHPFTRVSSAAAVFILAGLYAGVDWLSAATGRRLAATPSPKKQAFCIHGPKEDRNSPGRPMVSIGVLQRGRQPGPRCLRSAEATATFCDG